MDIIYFVFKIVGIVTKNDTIKQDLRRLPESVPNKIKIHILKMTC